MELNFSEVIGVLPTFIRVIDTYVIENEYPFPGEYKEFLSADLQDVATLKADGTLIYPYNLNKEIKIYTESYRNYKSFICLFKDNKLQSYKEDKTDWIEHVG